MVKRWCVRLTIVGEIVSGASCLIKSKDHLVGGAADGGSGAPDPCGEGQHADGRTLDRPVFGSLADLLGG
jgi:hypothetical protein